MRTLGSIGTWVLVGLVGAGFGCGDDEGSGGGGGGATASATTTASGTAASTTATSSTTAATTGAGGEGGAPAALFATMVRGTLFTADMVEAQNSHDMIAAAGEAQAVAAGDLAHDVHLGTDILGTTPNEFLGLDRWNDAANMAAFYSDPAIQMAFGSLFAGPPTVEAFEHQPTWHNWGDLDAADAIEPHYWAIIRGRLASSDLDAMQSLHDQIAGDGQGPAEALGDHAHVVFLSLADPQEFLAVDIWDNPDGPVTLYTDPQFGAAFAQLFESPPSLTIHVSTDWYQW